MIFNEFASTRRPYILQCNHMTCAHALAKTFNLCHAVRVSPGVSWGRMTQCLTVMCSDLFPDLAVF